jgi:hypothetical protein
MDPARMLTESLTPRPELENSQGQFRMSLDSDRSVRSYPTSCIRLVKPAVL